MLNRLGLKCAALTLAMLTVPSVASAQTFGKAGEFSLSAERLFGFVATSTKLTPPNGVATTSRQTSVDLLANVFGSATSNYSFARIGFDYFVIDGLTLGGAVGYFHFSASQEANGVSQDTGTGSAFLFSPRVGYAAMFNDTVGIWPRGGFTYVSASSKNNAGTVSLDETRSALTLEAMLVISPVPHAGFLIGPTFDVGLGGSNKQTQTLPAAPAPITTSTDATGTDIGVQAGLFVYF